MLKTLTPKTEDQFKAAYKKVFGSYGYSAKTDTVESIVWRKAILHNAKLIILLPAIKEKRSSGGIIITKGPTECDKDFDFPDNLIVYSRFSQDKTDSVCMIKNRAISGVSFENMDCTRSAIGFGTTGRVVSKSESKHLVICHAGNCDYVEMRNMHEALAVCSEIMRIANKFSL